MLAAYGPRPQSLDSMFAVPDFSISEVFFDSQYIVILVVTIVMVPLQYDLRISPEQTIAAITRLGTLDLGGRRQLRMALAPGPVAIIEVLASLMVSPSLVITVCEDRASWAWRWPDRRRG